MPETFDVDFEPEQPEPATPAALPGVSGNYIPEQPPPEVIDAQVDAQVRPPRRHLPAVRSQEPPHSLEAEEYLLSCIFIDGDDTLARCKEQGITPRSFFSPANSLIFSRLLSLQERGQPADVAILAEDLKATGNLDAIGGFAYLTQVSSRIPTTAQAPYFIERVRSLQRLRDLVALASSTLEDAASTQDPESLIQQAHTSLRLLAENRTGLDLLEGRSFASSAEEPKPEAVFSAAHTTISTPGNLTALYAQAKTGKTAVVGAMLSSTMLPPGSVTDCLGFAGSNPEGHAVLHLDTEQSRYDWQQMIRRSCKRAGLDTPPAWLHSYHLTGLPAQACRSILRPLLLQAKKRHHAVRALFIDGIGDLVVNPNDPDECFPFITELHSLAIEFHCAIICVLHMNAGSENEKGRGHLGSQLERKAESNITMDKKDEVTRYWGVKQRGKALTKDKAPAFKWDDEAKMHMSVDAEDVPERPKGGRPQKYSITTFLKSFPTSESEAVPAAIIHRNALDYSSISLNSFKDLCLKALEEGFIKQTKTKDGRVAYFR